MAVEVATLKATLVADTSAYSAGLTRAGAQSERFERRSTKAMARTGAAVKSMAKVGAIALGVGLAVGVKESIGAFREQQKVSRQTSAVLKSTGKAAGMSKKSIENLATALSKKTGVDDEAVQSTENLLLTFTKIGKKGGIFKKTTALALDMSAALGQDTKSSAIQLGKALNNPIKGVTALQRVGVAFTDKQKEQIKTLVDSGKTMQAQKLIMKEVASEFGGSAAAIATPMDHLKVTLDSVAEVVGGVLIPWIDKGAQALNNFLTGMLEGGGAGAGFVSSIKDAVTGAKGAFAGLKVGLGLDKDGIEGGDKIQALAMNIGESIKNSGLLDSIARIKASMLSVWDTAKRTWAGVRDAFTSVFGSESGIGQDITTIVAAIGKVVAAASSLYAATVKRALPGIITAFKGFAQVIRGVVRIIAGILTLDFGKAWDGVKDIFSGAFKALRGIIRSGTAPIREGLSRVWDGISSGVDKAWRSVYTTLGGWINKVIGIINKIPGVNIGKINMGNGNKPTSRGGKDEPKTGGGRAIGGWIGRPGERGADNVPVMLGRGEAVLNHQQQRIANRFIPGGLGAVFSATRGTKHYMAGGGFAGLPKAGSLGLGGGAGQVMSGITGWALKQAKKYLKKLNPFGGGGGGGGSTTGLTPRVQSALSFARSNGWGGSVTSGFRSRAKQQQLYDLYLQGKGNLAAPPGNSMHERGLAVDVTDHGNFARAMGQMSAGKRLHRKIAGEPWHFSTTGFAKGGFVGMAKGGKVGLGGLKSLWTKAGGSSKMASIMAAIAMAESGGNRSATNKNTNGTIDTGLWQINSVHGLKNLTSATGNARAALKIFKKQGLKAWSAYNNGSYKKYLEAAKKAKGGGLTKQQRKALAKKRSKNKSNRRAAFRDLQDAKLDSRLATAESTPGTGDDTKVLNDRIKLNMKRLEKVKRLLKRKGLTSGRRASYLGQSAELTRSIKSDQDAIAGFSGDSGGGVGGGGTDPAADLAAAITANTAAQKELADELRKQNKLRDDTRNIVRGDIEQAVLDFFNQGIGGRLAGGVRLASAGVNY